MSWAPGSDGRPQYASIAGSRPTLTSVLIYAMFRLTAALYLTVTGTMALRIMTGISFDTERIHSLVSRQTGTNPAPPSQCATPCNAIEPIIATGVSSLLALGRETALIHPHFLSAKYRPVV